MASADDDDTKTDAGRGRFKVTEQLESWSAEEERRRQRQAATNDRYVTDARPRSVDDGSAALQRHVERLNPVSLRPHDFTFEPTCFRLGIGVSESVFTHQDLVEIAAVDPWPAFEVEWKISGGHNRRRFLPRFAKDRDGFAESVETLFARLEERFAHRVTSGWRAEAVVAWEVVDRFPDEDEPESETRGGYRMSAKEQPREEVLARRAAPTGRETMLDWLASTPDYPFREHPREVLVSEAFVYVRRRDETVCRVPLSTLRKMRSNRDGDAVYVFGRNTTLLVPHREGCDVAKLLQARASSVDYMQPQR